MRSVIKKKTFLTLVIVFFMALLLPLAAQQDGDDISLGSYKIFYSEILKEARRLLIHLPQNYKKHDRHYPVVFLLYGDQMTTYFAQTVSILDRLGPTGRIPEMILVSIENTDRYRDLLPLTRDGKPTGIDRFIDFFRQELVPWVDKTYRTKDFRLILAPQAGANFAFYTMFRNPELFSAAVITSPFRWKPGREQIIGQAEKILLKGLGNNQQMFITYHDGDPLELEGNKYLESFNDYVKTNNPKGFNLFLNFKKDWDEFIGPVGFREGLKTLFKDYPFPDRIKVKDLKDILDYYQKLSEFYAYQVDIPEMVLVSQYDKLKAEKKGELANKILDYILKTNPASLNGLWRIADNCFRAGSLEQALAYLKKMVDLMGSDAGMILQRIRQIEKMIEQKKSE